MISVVCGVVVKIKGERECALLTQAPEHIDHYVFCDECSYWI